MVTTHSFGRSLLSLHARRHSHTLRTSHSHIRISITIIAIITRHCGRDIDSDQKRKKKKKESTTEHNYDKCFRGRLCSVLVLSLTPCAERHSLRRAEKKNPSLKLELRFARAVIAPPPRRNGLYRRQRVIRCASSPSTRKKLARKHIQLETSWFLRGIRDRIRVYTVQVSPRLPGQGRVEGAVI